ncbi:MAG: hypothetical protein HY926_04345 [Elusimicrobia bacterium]|nr:hypothetical protein [Elusimicrobiota bacterium]
MEDGKTRLWTALIPAVLLAQTLWLGAGGASAPDPWWHLKTGELIRQTWSLPRSDPFSYVLAGRPWTSFEWLFQVALHLVYGAAGGAGLAALRAAAPAAAFLLLYRLGRAPFWAGLLASLAALATSGWFVARPQISDFLLLAAFLTVLDSPRPGRKAWLLLPGLQLLWANLHGGAALLGAGLVLLKAASCFRRDRRAAGGWLALAGACLPAMAVNPHGAGVFAHSAAALFFPGQEFAGGWRGMTSPLSWQGACLAAAAAVAVWAWESEPHLALTALALAALGWFEARHLHFAVMAALPLAARLLESLRPVRTGRGRALAAAALMILPSALFLLLAAPRQGRADLPDRAVRYLDDNGVTGRMFNTYGLGGYLIWRAWPRRQVFVDDRDAAYGAEFIAEAARWSRPEVWERLDARWGFDYALVGNSPGYAAGVLDASPRWALVFWDDAALVYLKRTPAHFALIRRDAYRRLQPNQLTFAYLARDLKDPRKSAEMRAELDRAVAGSELNVNATQMRAFVLAEVGRPDDAVRDLQDVIRRFPRKPGPYMSLGWFHERSRRLLAARQVYEEGIRVAKWSGDRTSRAYLENNLGSVELRLGNRERARKLFAHCLKLEPRHPQARRNLELLEKGAGAIVP